MPIFVANSSKLMDVISLARQILGQTSWDIDLRYLMMDRILSARTQQEFDLIREDVIAYTVAKSNVIRIELKFHIRNSTP